MATSFDALDAEMARLKAMTGGGSSLEPVLSGEPDVEHPGNSHGLELARGDGMCLLQPKGPENPEIRSWAFFLKHKALARFGQIECDSLR